MTRRFRFPRAIICGFVALLLGFGSGCASLDLDPDDGLDDASYSISRDYERLAPQFAEPIPPRS